jgi:hypothetical protein
MYTLALIVLSLLSRILVVIVSVARINFRQPATKILPAEIEVAWLVRAAVVVDLASFLGKPAGGHQGITVKPDRLEGFTPGAKCHDLYGLGYGCFFLDPGDPFFFYRC